MRPSFIGACLNGLFLAIAVIMIIVNYRSVSKEMLILFVLLLSIACEVHAITHYYEEVYYHFNPLRNKWVIHSEPETKQ